MCKIIEDVTKAITTHELAVELGSENTRAYVKGKGCILHVPSVLVTTRDARGQSALTVGREARHILLPDSDNGIAPAWLKKDGFLSDDTVAESLLRYVFTKTSIPSHLLLFIPHNFTKVEERALNTAALAAGASKVVMRPSALGIAVSAAHTHSTCIPRVVVDIGGHTTEIALITSNGVEYSKLIRLGGRAMSEAVSAYLRRKHNLLTDDALAEKIKIRLASAFPASFERVMEVQSRDFVTGIKRNVTVNSGEISETIAPLVEKTMEAIRAALEMVPPELASDIWDNGILLTGGGSRLHGFEQRIQAIGLPVVRKTNMLAKLFKA